MKPIALAVLILGVLVNGGCRPKQTGEDGAQGNALLPAWPRPYFQPTGAKALVWYQVYGRFSDTIEISRSKYRCNGIPRGITLSNHRRADMDYGIISFLDQPLLTARLMSDLPKLATAVETAPDCTIIHGEIPDSPDLDYLQDVVGLVTWFLDNGALAVLDPQTLTWYDRDKWRSNVFEPKSFVEGNHVVILWSAEADATGQDLLWLHTRGMRKFARPDLSVHYVPAQYREAVMSLVNGLIEMQASGHVLAERQSITVPSLPPGMTWHSTGNLDDPDFHNTRIEIVWPQ